MASLKDTIWNDAKQGAKNLENKLFGYSSKDILDGYEKNIDKNMQDFTDTWSSNNDILQSALTRNDGSERSIRTALDEYDAKQKQIQQNLAGQQDASLNYGTDQMNTFQNNVAPAVGNVVAGASASRVFGTNTNAGQQAMNNASANNWNTALNQGSTIGSLNTSALGSQANMAESKLTNDAMPQQDQLAMNQDWAGTYLQTQTGKANNRAMTEANDSGYMGNAFNLVKGVWGK